MSSVPLSFGQRLILAFKFVSGIPLVDSGKVTSPAVLDIAVRYIKHEDPDVRSMAASLIVQSANKVTQAKRVIEQTRQKDSF